MAYEVRDPAAFHIGTHHAGEFGYTAPLRRGDVEVLHDSKRYIYRMWGFGRQAKAMRAYIHRAWGERCGRVVIRGRYPSYTVETET